MTRCAHGDLQTRTELWRRIMPEEQMDNTAAMALLNEILETELAGVVRYTHYSLMVFGHSRIPIVDWLRGEANACLSHAIQAGELVTSCLSRQRVALLPQSA